MTVTSLAEARRNLREREHRAELHALGIQTRENVLLHRDSLIENASYWHSEARRWQRQAEDMALLCWQAEVHLKASETLREAAEGELARVKAALEGG